MSFVHLHLLLNHVPVVGVVFVILLFGLALMRRSDELGKASLRLFGLLGLTAIVVYFTGEPAEESVERLPDISRSIVERHENVALVATIVMGSFGALALATLVMLRGRALPQWVAAAGLVGACVSAALMGYTANLGGQIRHSEIRSAAMTPDASRPASGEVHGGRERR